MPENDFDAIRPYHQKEVPAALKRIAANPLLDQLMNYLFDPADHDLLRNKLLKATSTDEFQQYFMLPVISSIIRKTADELTVSGIENLSHSESNVFIANHRDILLDSAILGMLMHENEFKTPEITWGDNLILSKFIEDIGKSNKMITVFREGTPKEMFKNSLRLSEYIRQSVTKRNQSVWIAQRKGRTKNGCDTTDVGVLKMLSLTNSDDLIASFSELNIIPITISYEWEPCDGMKVKELSLSEKQEYVKTENEDLYSIIGGVVSKKGRIHLSIGKKINQALTEIDTSLRKNDLLAEIARHIDIKIQDHYKIWPSNYYAYDLLNNSSEHNQYYTEKDKAIFRERMDNACDVAGGDKKKLTELFLELYAMPLVNKLSFNNS